MVTLTTHDTKRSEDVRARLLTLSEVPHLFRKAIACWTEMNAVHKADGLPDPNTEYLYYQTLVGAWPLSVDRALAYMEKATREAKQQTSWTQRNARFEEQLQQFIRATLSSAEFVACVESFVRSIDNAGQTNSLTQTLLKCTVPGVPDLYQGSELWDLRLVDPDNRGVVDFAHRRQLLAEMQTLQAQEILERAESGMPKLWTIQRALQVRRRFFDCFGTSGAYSALFASGEWSEHVVAFLRGDRVVTVVPRMPIAVRNGWSNTSVPLPKGVWTNVLTGEVISGGDTPIKHLLTNFPVALLTRED